MKKLLLTGIAALFLATGVAHAADQLPEYMLGRWCYGNDVSTEAQVVYFRPNLRAEHVRFNDVLRHEIAHCNGWPADHPDMEGKYEWVEK